MAVDYADIGRRIKAQRIRKGLTQEKLSEMIGVGPSHMSHIESGKTGPSFEVFVSILNALNCSADALLCREIQQGKEQYQNWLTELISDCDPVESKILSDTLVSLKATLRKNKAAE